VQTTFHNDGANSITVHKAQIHSIPEASQEDSGFNSPRFDLQDSLNNTPNTTPQSDTVDLQNNLKKNEPEPQVPSGKPRNEGFSKSIDNLHGEGVDLGNGSMWSSSSQQTVREAANPVPHLPPPREWTLPRPVLRDRNGTGDHNGDQNGDHDRDHDEGTQETAPELSTRDAPKPRVDSAPKQATDYSRNRHSTTVTEKNDMRAEVNSKSGFRLSVSLKESSVVNTEMRPSIVNVKPRSQEVTMNMNTPGSCYSLDRKKKPLRRDSGDKVKRNLGSEMENAREGTSLHQRVFQEYHNNNHHHSKTSLNGTMPKGDFEVVGIV
jgi:hypothetical protein